MIHALYFGAGRTLADGRTVREPSFVPRSTLPIALACTLANGVCEQLRRLLSVNVEVELIEPTVPSGGARGALFAGAHITRVRGTLADAFVVVRSADARRFVALAFGEGQRADGAPLSGIELRVLERLVAAVLPLCAPLCGPLGAVSPGTSELAIRECAAYFELRTSAAPRAAIGFALTRDPTEETGPSLRFEDLHDVPVEACVELGRGSISLAGLSTLRAGVAIPLATRLDDPGVLRVGGHVIARGTCGVQGERCAFSVGTAIAQSDAA